MGRVKKDTDEKNRDTLKVVQLDNITSIFNVSPLHAVECYQTLDEIIETLDDRAIIELFDGGEADIDAMLKGMLDDVYSTLYTGNRNLDFMPKYTDSLSESVEEILRCNNLTYFITSVLPDFQLSFHHLEWGDLVHHHNKLCIEAARDHGKCEAVGTKVVMFDGRIKKVEDVKVGEYLMGVDSTPRLVTATYRGKDDHMYRIDQSKGDSYTVNSRHICTFIIKNRNQENRIIDLDVPTLKSYSDNYIHNHIRGFKVGWEMPYRNTPEEPYSFGLKINKKSGYIPDEYIYNSREVRLSLLAGLLDRFGRLCENSYRLFVVNSDLANSIVYIANSVGFRTIREKQAKIGYARFKISISGNIGEIPVRVCKKYAGNKDFGIIDGIRPSVISSIKITDVGEGEYVSITTDGDHRFLLADGTVTHNSYYFSNAYVIWQLYRYSPPKQQAFSRRPSKSNSNRGFLFSFSLQQAVDLIEILKGTIENTDVLRERLMPENSKDGAWASTNIVCKNGARLTGKGFGSSVRGAHPYWIVVDDGLKDNVIYSQLQRQKSIDYFHSVIMNMLVPGGQIVVIGTPFHFQDLYGDLKSKSGWFVIEYPAIFPDGRILWPQRWSFKDLIDKKNTQGNIIFSRENLCRPIVSDSSIFPLDILKRSLVRMENYTLVRNRDDFPKKFGKVVAGCDFAISGNVGVDYYFYTVFGVDEENGMWLLSVECGKGKLYDEQLQILKGINVRYRPDVMVFESNVFQQIFTDESIKYGLPVVPHNTGTEKNDLSKGWCALATMFERGMFHFPIGDKISQDAKDIIFEQLSSVAFTDNGLQSVGSHDDACSSIWLATLGRNISVGGGKFTFI